MAMQKCSTCGRKCRRTLNMCPHCFPPRDAMTGHKKAQHMARYSHKPWIAWQDTAGQMQAAQATPENLERAIADIGETGKISGYFGERHGHLARKAMAEVWLSNARIGMLLC